MTNAPGGTDMHHVGKFRYIFVTIEAAENPVSRQIDLSRRIFHRAKFFHSLCRSCNIEIAEGDDLDRIADFESVNDAAHTASAATDESDFDHIGTNNICRLGDGQGVTRNDTCRHESGGFQKIPTDPSGNVRLCTQGTSKNSVFFLSTVFCITVHYCV